MHLNPSGCLIPERLPLRLVLPDFPLTYAYDPTSQSTLLTSHASVYAHAILRTERNSRRTQTSTSISRVRYAATRVTSADIYAYARIFLKDHNNTPVLQYISNTYTLTIVHTNSSQLSHMNMNAYNTLFIYRQKRNMVPSVLTGL